MTWTRVTFAESDAKPGKAYAIERREDGALRCACESFRFRRGEIGTVAKTCKHLDAFRALDFNAQLFASATTATASVPTRTYRKTARGGTVVTETRETFTFTRRAMNFGSVPTGGG